MPEQPSGEQPGAAKATDEAPSLRRRAVTGAWQTLLGHGLSVLAAFGVQVALARTFTFTLFANYLVLWTIVIVVGTATRFGISRTVVRTVSASLAKGDAQKARAYTVAAIIYACVPAALSVPVVAFALEKFFPPISETANLVPWFVAAASALEGVRLVVAECVRGYYRIGLCQLVGTPGRSVFYALATLLLIYVDRLDLQSAFVVLVAANLLSTLTGIGALHGLAGQARSNWGWIATDIRRDLLGGSVSFLVMEMAVIALLQGDLLIAGARLPEQQVAAYGVALRMMLLLSAIQFVMNSVMTPIVAGLAGRDERQRIAMVVKSVSGAGVLAGLLVYLTLFLGGGAFIEAVFGTEYHESAVVLLILAAGPLVTAAFGVSGLVLIMYHHERVVSVITVSVAVATLATEWFLGPSFGAVGVAAASAGGTVMQNLLLVFALRRKLNISVRPSMRALVNGRQ